MDTLVASYRIHGVDAPFEYHSHEDYEVYIFHAGSCRYLIHNQIYDLVPGDIILMDGLTLHKPNVQPYSTYVRSVVQFSPHLIKGILNEMKSTYLLEPFEKLSHCLIRTRENSEYHRLGKIISRMSEIREESMVFDAFEETEIKVLLLQMLVVVHRLFRKSDFNYLCKRFDKAEHIENIATFIQCNYMKSLTLDEIAQNLNISKSYMSHLFKEMTGFTIMEYVMACRLAQVKYMLEMYPEKSIKKISYMCGFESASHFSRYFKDKVGMTARQYRLLRQKKYEESIL